MRRAHACKLKHTWWLTVLDESTYRHQNWAWHPWGTASLCKLKDTANQIPNPGCRPSLLKQNCPSCSPSSPTTSVSVSLRMTTYTYTWCHRHGPPTPSAETEMLGLICFCFCALLSLSLSNAHIKWFGPDSNFGLISVKAQLKVAQLMYCGPVVSPFDWWAQSSL